ncbi:NAD-dependent epimerase/dehydratase family protein [Halioglobus maricola]|uniref:NAD-dependent epimerase/dehydratase family protein n=1 Tax=Halioglobus maricola TaxID=2601894 RepID=A0A5P9NHH0_9GAMM|nr:NAD(P)H-binding protein [Halioglobus maricola]QFU75232.1 NAD-dependent epimerase/dehydratase family protein [Halioglobus maricola]
MNSIRRHNSLRAFALLLFTAILAGCALSQQKLPASSIEAATTPPSRNTTIALLGATGMSGGYILREALARGYRVRALSRSPEKLAYLSNRIEVVVGDARDPGTIATLLAGSDVIVSAIGPSARAPTDLNSQTTANVIAAMSITTARPYLVVTGAAVELEQDHRTMTGWWVRQLALIRYPNLVRDRQLEYGLLAQSDVPWTLIRCPLINATDGEGSATASLETPPGTLLRAGELARFIVDEIERGNYVQMAPFIASE